MTMATLTATAAAEGASLDAGSRVRSGRTVHRAGAALFALSALFMTVIMLGASMAPGYDLSGGAISDLGTIQETASLFNGTLLVLGALNIAAGLLLWRAGASLAVLGVYVGAGLGAIGAGLVPLDRGGLHGLFALVAFALFNVEAIVSARLVPQPMAGISVAAGLAGLAFVALMAVGDAGNPDVFGPIGHGGAERMIVYPVMLWLLAFGGALMVSPSIQHRQRRP
jgi:hypothetical membrane protein